VTGLIVGLSALLCAVTVIHVIHAMSAAWWVFRWGGEWHRQYLQIEEAVAYSREADTRARIDLYDATHGASWLRFLGVKSYKLEKWALDASPPRRLALKGARFVWRWNFYAPGVSLVILVAAAGAVALPLAARDLLWVAALAIVVGMATIAVEGLVATLTFGSWAEYHHRWRRRSVPSASPVSINGIAIWLGCMLVSWLAASALIALSAMRFHGFAAFPYDQTWVGQVWLASVIALPWTVQGATQVHIVNAVGAAAASAVPAVYFGYVVVFLPAVFTGTDSRGVELRRKHNEP
jgi:hypothetical protein